MQTRTWTVDVFISEEGATTTARAVLRTGATREVVAVGSSRRNPHDPSVPEIGDEVATARALHGLGAALLEVATDDLAEVTEEPAQLLR